MTREEFEADFRRRWNITDEDWRIMGLRAVRCPCGPNVRGCPGWEMRFQPAGVDQPMPAYPAPAGVMPRPYPPCLGPWQ